MSDKPMRDKKNETSTYTKSWEKNGLSCRKEIRKVEGGYIVTVSKYGQPADGGKDAKYIDERKEYVTTENPLEEELEEKIEELVTEKKMFDFVSTPLMK